VSDPVQEIKIKLNIVDVIGEYVRLTRAGKHYKGLSPFKKEKTPSFYVSPEKGMYYDFSSNKGGDLFSFVQEMEGLDFKGALKILADRAGVVLTHEPSATRSERDALYGVLEDATQLYETKFREDQAAQEYLVGRGIQPETAHLFRIGLAPQGWSVAHDHLTSRGYSEALLEQAGMCKQSERGSYYDRFRSRIMFPIMDPSGRVIAFSGRIFGEAAQDEKNAKYLNSPETPLFDKGRTLYGYHRAKQFIRKFDFSIIVEGQMDLVLCHQAGYPNTVAASGTGLTDDHLALLDRLSKKVVLAFDADSAGAASTARAAHLALARSMDVKVVAVPSGKDPADAIRDNLELWKGAVRNAQHVVEHIFTQVLAEHRDSGKDLRALTLAVRDQVLPFVAQVRSAVDQAQFVRTLANRLDIAEDAVWQDVRTLLRERDTKPPARAEEPVRAVAERPRETLTRTEQFERALAGLLFWQESLDERTVTPESLKDMLAAHEFDVAPILARYSEERQALAFESEIAHGEAQDVPLLCEGYVREIVRERLKEERLRVSHELRAAEHGRDEQRTNELLTQFTTLSMRIEKLDRRG
jgi:DNA primase